MNRNLDERDTYWEYNIVNNETLDEFKNLY